MAISHWHFWIRKQANLANGSRGLKLAASKAQSLLLVKGENSLGIARQQRCMPLTIVVWPQHVGVETVLLEAHPASWKEMVIYENPRLQVGSMPYLGRELESSREPTTRLLVQSLDLRLSYHKSRNDYSTLFRSSFRRSVATGCC
jgi:hypothetical protein